MRHSLMLRARARSGPADAIDMALAAEAARFHHVYLSESHFDAGDGFANPFAVAAAISGRLKGIWIGVVPAIGMEHPLRVVEQANMLNILTRGRSIVVLSDRLEPRQYAGFGLPVPRNGLLEDLFQHLETAWSWEYQEDGPPLEFRSGPYAAKMAGRIMPAACPRRALETDSDLGVRDAARRGWAVHLRFANVPHTRQLIDTYRQVLTSVGHNSRVVQDCLDGLAVVVGERFDASIAELENIGAAEVRFDLAPEAAIRIVG
jgi:alkanesulfonate monooxygenase SsuD/methylene tetrahydromethanopterin reductase-like flavin-dependent oxidoreductase (luciferase family)